SRKARPGAPTAENIENPASDRWCRSRSGLMRTIAMSLLAVALVAAGTTMRAAPDQTARPGDMTEARLWIQNRTRADAIAVNLRAADIATPLRVQVANT